MGTSKSEVFSLVQNQLATWAKAFAHPARIAILEFLVKQPKCVCGDIVQELPLAQSTVSQHLKVLKDCGIVKGVIEGKDKCYCIDVQNWRLAQRNFNDLFDTFGTIDTCC